MSLNEISIKTVRIETLAIDTGASLSGATAFFCKYKNKIFMVTNWHVLSGRNPITNEPMHTSCALPGDLRCKLTWTLSKAPVAGGKVETSVVEADLTIPLFLKEDKMWSEHPTYGKLVDVAALQFTIEGDGINAFDIDQSVVDAKPLSVMDKVFIAGYPLSRDQTNNQFPIYKSGTIASEPNFHDVEPRIHIDSKTKPGMSGSPVVNAHTKSPSLDGTKIQFYGESNTLIGVYAGRDGLAESEFEAELGRIYPINECLVPVLEAAITDNKLLNLPIPQRET